MKWWILSVLLLGMICTGCIKSKPPATPLLKEPLLLDYSQLPEDFIIKVEVDTPYTIFRNGESFLFLITMKADPKGNYGEIDIVWGELEQEDISILRAGKRTAYLISYEGRDILYMYEKGDPIYYSAIHYIEFYDDHISSGSLGFGFSEEPVDPAKMPFARSVLSIGRGHAVVYCHPGELGAPEMNEREDSYFYFADEYKEDVLTLAMDLEVEVLDSPDAAKSERMLLEAGTTYRKYRTDNETIVDLLMEDGRVARFTIMQMFSEPHSIYMIDGEIDVDDAFRY